MNKLLKNLRFRRPEKPGTEIPVDIKEEEFRELYYFCKPYTMTSVERMYALYQSVKYIIENNIPGDFIECGVWRGGSAMLIARYFFIHHITDRKLVLYDTYEGMSEPTEADKDYRGVTAEQQLKASEKTNESFIWCLASLEDVSRNIFSTGISSNQVEFVKGMVEDTIPSDMPFERIAILRLDTDWYESTLHELTHLYPLLVEKGILIIDDYGHWQGCRKAVDEYFERAKNRLLLNRIDVTGRLGMKI